MARGMTGYIFQDGSVSMYNLFDKASLREIAENTANKVWKGFVTFGSAIAGVFRIFIVVRLIKIPVDTGMLFTPSMDAGLYILSAIWSSLTNLLHLARRPLNQNKGKPNPDAEGQKAPPQGNLRNLSSNVNAKNSIPLVHTDFRERLHEIEQISPKIISSK